MINENEMLYFHIYTDGACHNNKGKQGSWGYVILNDTQDRIIKQDYGYDPQTTSNRMELTAAIEAIDQLLYLCAKNDLKTDDVKFRLYSDSQYVVKGINEWMYNWKLKNFIDVKNPDLWDKLDNLNSEFKYSRFQWVKSHSGNKWNEYADKLCASCLFSNTGSEPFNWKSIKK